MSPHETIEDRLAEALDEVAQTTTLSPDAWSRIETRARRPRARRVMALAAAALGVTTVVVAAVVVNRDDDGPRIETPASTPTGPCELPASDVEVMVFPSASAAEIDGVRTTLENSSVVDSFTFVSQQQAYEIYRCQFADEPETVATADPSRLPSLFEVILQPGAEHAGLVGQLDGRTNVSVGVPLCDTREPASVQLYLEVATTPEVIAAAQATIASTPGVASVTFVSQEAEYEIFTCLFAHNADLVGATTPAALPPSFRLTLEPGADRAGLGTVLSTVPGVDEVIYPSRAPSPLPDLGFVGDE